MNIETVIAVMRMTALLLLALVAQPCSMADVRTLWSKKPGSESRLFAFEQNGGVGFIDPRGRVIVPATIAARIEDVGDFSNGLARVDDQGYVDEAGRLVIKKEYRREYDFSEGLAAYEAEGKPGIRKSNRGASFTGTIRD